MLEGRALDRVAGQFGGVRLRRIPSPGRLIIPTAWLQLPGEGALMAAADVCGCRCRLGTPALSRKHPPSRARRRRLWQTSTGSEPPGQQQDYAR